jgi:galactokinase
MELIVIDSGVPHQHAGGGYVTRRRESFAAAALLGVRVLRDVDLDDLQRASLPPLLARRARHVVTENRRVRHTVAALRRGDVLALGPLFAASHASMRDDYEISTPDVDALVTMAHRHPAITAARMTGGGFGGAVVIVARAGMAAAAARELRDEYIRMRQQPAVVLVPMNA